MDFAGTLARTPQQFAGTIGNDLVRIHVGRGTGAGLKNIEDEVIIELAIHNFLGSAYNRLGNLRIDGTQCLVHLGCSLFDLAESTNKLAWEAQAADRKIKYCALSTGTVISIYWNLHLAHRVALDTGPPCFVHKFTSFKRHYITAVPNLPIYG